MVAPTSAQRALGHDRRRLRRSNGQDATEGARHRNAFGTYLHGSLLPKNPKLADELLRLALSRRDGEVTLDPLDESVRIACTVALARARQERHAQRNVGAIRRGPEHARLMTPLDAIVAGLLGLLSVLVAACTDSCRTFGPSHP
ncbi:MAG: hypothetical protein U0556_13540 [Dehalococcoidia bacterium]